MLAAGVSDVYSCDGYTIEKSAVTFVKAQLVTSLRILLKAGAS
jgi:hypothetical protein